MFKVGVCCAVTPYIRVNTQGTPPNKKENKMEPGIYHQTILHDENCPTLFTRNMKDCKCKPEIKIAKSPNMEFTEKEIRKDLSFWKKIKWRFN